MSKMIKIDCCGTCPANKRVNGPSYDRFCAALYPKYKFFAPREPEPITEEVNFSITDESKILPNCPLEDSAC